MTLVIVRRSQFAAFGKLSQAFAGEADVRLIWDRRVHDRRRQSPPRAVAERRQEHRRDPSASWDDREYVVISATADGLALDLDQQSITSARALIRPDDPTRDVRHDLETDVRSDINALMTDGDPVSGTRQQTAMTSVDRVLLIDGDPAEARVVREALADSRDGPFAVEWVTRLSDGLDRLSRNGIRAVLLNMFLPDGEGLETFERLRLAAPQIPILVLSALAHEDLARHAAQHGAHDYLRLDHLNSYTLPQALRHVIDRKEHEIVERTQAEHALRTSERLNRTLVAHLPHRIVVKDRHSVVLFCNANFAKDFGRSPDEVIGKDAFDLYPRHLAEVSHADDQAVMARGVVKNIEEPYCVGGQERWVHTVKVPYRDEQGYVVGVLVVLEDITERRALEAQYQQAQRMEAIGMLAGGVAHDFNNLLTAILGYSELLTEQIGADKPMGRDLREITAAAQRAAALTRQLLAFSRQQVLAVAPLNITTVVRGVEAMLRRLLGEQITITTALADDLDPVMADVMQLEQLLVNLSVNARDAMPQGGSLTLATGNITLDAGYAAAHPGANAGSYASLRVTDTGTGMSAETQERIFEPFFTTKERGRGTGLGLAAVHGIVRQLGGYIEVQSEPARGSTFTIYLPKTDQAAQVPIEPAPAMSPAGTETILLVEDEGSVRAFVKITLRRFGYQVIEADTAEAALTLLSGIDTPIHVLLTDIVLPRMDGRELAVRVKRDRPHTRVLFMSGYASALSTSEALLEPGMQFLEKPFTAQALLTKTRQLLGMD